MGLGSFICALRDKDQETLYRILFENHLEELQAIVFDNDINNHNIMTYCMDKLKNQDELMRKFLKGFMRASYQKEGLQDFINEVLADKKDLVGIELGSFAGDSTEMFLNSGSFKKLYCVDAWTEGIFAYLENIFDERFAGNKKIAKIKEYTINASKQFQLNSIDFIYIDASHDYNSVKNDILHYYPKMKSGAIISGHDYLPYHQGVIDAVNEIFGKPIKVFKDNSWYVIK